MAREVQTVLFHKSKSPSDVNDGDGWTEALAKSWLKEHDFKAPAADDPEEGEYLRFRQFDPDECNAGTYGTLQQDLPVGIKMTVCERKRSARRERKRTARVFNLDRIEIREVREGEGRKLVGHAAVFNELAEIGGYFKEKILPGAFKDSIATDDIRSVWNHNPDYVLGRNKAGTLELSEDDIGLAVIIDPPDTQWANDFLTTIDRGDVSQMSFMFTPLTDRWEKIDGDEVRIIEKVKLWEVSPVTFPAYPMTDIGLRDILRDETELDLDVFARAILRHSRGIELSPCDRAAVEAAFDQIATIIETGSETSRSFDILRKRLDLAEAETEL